MWRRASVRRAPGVFSPASCSWLPRRLLLVRHGESTANVDRHVYSTTPDWQIPLTERGRAQSYDCGKRLRRIIGDEPVYIYYSPYARTRQTLAEMRKSLSTEQIQGEREDERLREQEMGNYQPMADMDATWQERQRYGRLYYRFPYGESGLDVGDRVSNFFDSLLRERVGLLVPGMNDTAAAAAAAAAATATRDTLSTTMTTSSSASALPLGWLAPAEHALPAAQHKRHGGSSNYSNNNNNNNSNNNNNRSDGDACDSCESVYNDSVLPPNDNTVNRDHNVLIIAHGLLIRLFVGRWFRVPVEVVETMYNPPNCAIVVLERDDAAGRLVMTDVSKQLFGSSPLLQRMRFDGDEHTHWYHKDVLNIANADALAAARASEDDDENHYSHSAAHNAEVGAPAPSHPVPVTPPHDTTE